LNSGFAMIAAAAAGNWPIGGGVGGPVPGAAVVDVVELEGGATVVDGGPDSPLADVHAPRKIAATSKREPTTR
jgi:hypothetical protein